MDNFGIVYSDGSVAFNSKEEVMKTLHISEKEVDECIRGLIKKGYMKKLAPNLYAFNTRPIFKEK